MADVHGVYHYCDQCDFKARTKYLVKEHKRFKHEGASQITCSYGCKNKFRSKSDLMAHVQGKHNKVKYECEICGYKNANDSYVKAHILGVHAGERFQCKECDESFENMGKLVRHRSKVHKSKALSLIHI